jgi:hypothetical protein
MDGGERKEEMIDDTPVDDKLAAMGCRRVKWRHSLCRGKISQTETWTDGAVRSDQSLGWENKNARPLSQARISFRECSLDQLQHSQLSQHVSQLQFSQELQQEHTQPQLFAAFA